MAKKRKPAKKLVKAVKTDKNNLLVKIIEDKTDELTTALGITPENANRLHKIGEKAFRSTDTISATMEQISKHCNHANELMWMGFILGSNMMDKRNQRERKGSEVIHINGGKMPEGLGIIIEEILKKHRDKGKPGPDKKD